MGAHETKNFNIDLNKGHGPLLAEGFGLQAAMFAMLACFGAEVSTRTPLFIQIQKAPLAILATFVTIIAASVSFHFSSAAKLIPTHKKPQYKGSL